MKKLHVGVAIVEKKTGKLMNEHLKFTGTGNIKYFKFNRYQYVGEMN